MWANQIICECNLKKKKSKNIYIMLPIQAFNMHYAVFNLSEFILIILSSKTHKWEERHQNKTILVHNQFLQVLKWILNWDQENIKHYQPPEEQRNAIPDV